MGVILGIQFLLWTIGGLYFSWSNMDDVHGDFQKKPEQPVPGSFQLVSPTVAMNNIRLAHGVDSFAAVQLIQILDKPVYQLKGVGHHQHANNIYLANALTGALRGPLTKEEAIAVAKQRFNGEPEIKSVTYLTATGGHHEYRESALPAYAVTFAHPSGTTVYVSANLGTVQKFRNSKWRVFDFLWMLHTMDYSSRDNIGNLLLRIFSIFGLVTVMSGFVLYWISSGLFRKSKRMKRAARPAAL